MKRFQSCLNLHLSKTLVIQKEYGEDFSCKDNADIPTKNNENPPNNRDRSLSEVRMYINASNLYTGSLQHNHKSKSGSKLHLINNNNNNNNNNHNNNNSKSNSYPFSSCVGSGCCKHKKIFGKSSTLQNCSTHSTCCVHSLVHVVHSKEGLPGLHDKTQAVETTTLVHRKTDISNSLSNNLAVEENNNQQQQHNYVKKMMLNPEALEELNLPCTAKEMREILGSKRRKDPRIINKMDFRRKLEIVQTL